MAMCTYIFRQDLPVIFSVLISQTRCYFVENYGSIENMSKYFFFKKKLAISNCLRPVGIKSISNGVSFVNEEPLPRG